jgi:hypothetical protein
MDLSNAISLLQLQVLQVDSVTARPSAELYSRCKLAGSKDIRLLRLLPATKPIEAVKVEQPLVALMFSRSLSELKGRYESLPSVWGSEKMPKSITILFVEPGNEAFMFECSITENLWMAFTDLRSTSRHRDIWTDALFVSIRTTFPRRTCKLLKCETSTLDRRKTLAHLGPRFDGLETLVAYRACFWTKYWFFPRPPTLRTVHAVSSRTRNCESEPNSIGFRPGHDAEAHSIFRPTLWTFIYFPDANRSDNCYWFHRLGSRLHT